MSTSDAVKPSCWKEKGSNAKPSNTDACITKLTQPKIKPDASESPLDQNLWRDIRSHVANRSRFQPQISRFAEKKVKLRPRAYALVSSLSRTTRSFSSCALLMRYSNSLPLWGSSLVTP